MRRSKRKRLFHFGVLQKVASRQNTANRAGAACQLEVGLQLGGLGLALKGGADETACVAIEELRGTTYWLLGLLGILREDA